MKIRAFTLSVCLLLIANVCLAQEQYRNQFFISNGYRYVPKVYNVPDYKFSFIFPLNTELGDQLGASYQRYITDHFGIGATFAAWTWLKNGFGGSSGFIEYQPLIKGNLTGRSGFKMADVSALYRMNFVKRHTVKAAGGISYTNGTNTVIDTVFTPKPGEGIIYTHLEKATYWGPVARVDYEYALFHKRISVGANFEWRKYFGIFSYQLLYGTHVGFNF